MRRLLGLRRGRKPPPASAKGKEKTYLPMTAILLAIGFGASLATFLGGRLALRFQDRLHLVLGFSAGAVMGVALFDLLPEAIEFGGNFGKPAVVTAFVALGFVIYMFAERGFRPAEKPAEDEHGDHSHTQRGFLGAGSLTFHSFLDGVGIGLAFQVSATLGGIVAIGVIAHDFSDGINTVHLVLAGGGKVKGAGRWLVADALAPMVGIASTFLVRIPTHAFSPVLGLFTGFFLYIGASDLIPESHHRHPQLWTSCATVMGLALIYLAVQLANI
jgi:ZIP family zinc transporter